MKQIGRLLFLGLMTISLASIAQEDTWEYHLSNAYLDHVGTFGDSIWFRSAGGIIKVNANTLEAKRLTRLNSGLSHQVIYGFAEDLDGVKWFSNRYKITSLDEGEWTVYGTENSGIPDNYGSSEILLSPNGNKVFIYGGNGIVTFDGSNWTTYNSDNSPLTTNDIFFLDMAPNGSIYFISSSMLYVYSNGSIAPVNAVNDLIAPISTIELVCDQNNITYISSSIGLIRLENGDLDIYTADNSDLPSNSLSSLAVENQNGLWLESDDQIFRFSDGNFESIAPFLGFGVEISPFGNAKAYWVDQSVGIGFYDNGVMTTIPFPSFNPYFFSIAHVDAEGGIWADVRGVGLAYYNGVEWQNVSIPGAGFPTNYTTELALDQEGNPWFGFIDGDVHTLQNGEWIRYYNDQFGIDFGQGAKSISQWEDKMVLLYPGRLIIPENGEFTTMDCSTDPELCGLSLGAVASDEDENLWLINTWSGLGGVTDLIKYDGSVWETTEIFSENGFFDSNQLYVASSDEVYIGSNNNGFAIFSGGSLSFYNTENSPLPTNTVRCFLKDQNGIIWIGTSEGLVKKEGNNWVTYDLANLGVSEGFNAIRDIDIDSEGVLWMAVYQTGLVAFNGEDNWNIWTLDDSELVDELVWDIEVAPDGVKWLSGNLNAASFVEGVSLSVLENFNEQTKIIPFPNPSSGRFKIKTTSDEQITRVELLDLQGKVLKTWSSENRLYDISHLATGVFILRIEQDKTTWTGRILKE